MDCVNFVAGVFEGLGIISPLPARPYADDWWHRPGAIEDLVDQAIARLRPGFHALEIEDPRPGDLVLLAQLRRSRTTTHVAFLLEEAPNRRILHARMGRAVCADLLPEAWRITRTVRVAREGEAAA